MTVTITRGAALAICLAVLAAAGFGAAPPAHAFDSAPVPDSITEKYGETRAYFRDWLAVCTPGEAACRAVAYAGKVGHVGDYQLYVHSDRPGLDYRLVFVPIAVMLDTARAIELAVDGESLGSFDWQADDGYYREGNVINEFTFGQSRSNLDVLPAMTVGTSMALAFTDEHGQRGTVTFSLRGLTNALLWMDAFRSGE